MQVFNQLLFDDTISGTTTAWYTPDQFNDLLGRADNLVIMAQVSAPSGSSPTLTVGVEASADGRHWANNSNVVTGGDLTSDLIFTDSVGPLLSLVRLKITLGGTDPECRLKLYATGHAF